MKRLNPMIGISDSDVFTCIDSLCKYFKLPSDTIVSRNYYKTDSISTIEMYTFASCVNSVASVNENWLKGHIKKIESNKNINNAYGSLWEVIFAGLLIGSNIPVTLHTDSNPGIDVSANINNTTINFSLKRYDKSTHYISLELFFNRLLKIVKGFKCPQITVLVILKKYPDEITISNISKKILSFDINNPNYVENNDKYILNIKKSVQHDCEVNAKCHSYQLTLLSELHKNEKKNLFDKIDEAVYNLQQFKKTGTNIVAIHLNQNMPIDSISEYTKEYFEINKQSQIDAVFFYQPCVVSDEKSTQLCHVFNSFFNQNKVGVRPSDWKIQVITVPSGLVTTGSCINILKFGDTQFNINEKYCFQSGEIYQKPIDDGQGNQHGELLKRGHGILVHSTIEQGNQIFALKGNFAMKDELEIL
jgi:hypothetical protein